MGRLNIQYKNETIPEGVELLISIMLRYPEMGSVRYVPKSQAIKFNFMFRCGDVPIELIRENLPLALEMFHKLENRVMTLCKIECQCEEGIGNLFITRDVESMTQNEVGLIVELIKNRVGSSLIYDEAELPEEELLYQEEIISHMLDSIRNLVIDKNVIAVREEGRVLLFRN